MGRAGRRRVSRATTGDGNNRRRRPLPQGCCGPLAGLATDWQSGCDGRCGRGAPRKGRAAPSNTGCWAAGPAPDCCAPLRAPSRSLGCCRLCRGGREGHQSPDSPAPCRARPADRTAANSSRPTKRRALTPCAQSTRATSAMAARICGGSGAGVGRAEGSAHALERPPRPPSRRLSGPAALPGPAGERGRARRRPRQPAAAACQAQPPPAVGPPRRLLATALHRRSLQAVCGGCWGPRGAAAHPGWWLVTSLLQLRRRAWAHTQQSRAPVGDRKSVV